MHQLQTAGVRPGRFFFFISPPLAGEGGEHREPGGGSLRSASARPTRLLASLAATLPFQGRDGKNYVPPFSTSPPAAFNAPGWGMAMTL
jgi:hypothetical protein